MPKVGLGLSLALLKVGPLGLQCKVRYLLVYRLFLPDPLNCYPPFTDRMTSCISFAYESLSDCMRSQVVPSISTFREPSLRFSMFHAA